MRGYGDTVHAAGKVVEVEEGKSAPNLDDGLGDEGTYSRKRAPYLPCRPYWVQAMLGR